MDHFQDHVIHHGTVALAIRDYGGHGSPIVLLHGGTRNLGDWAMIAPILATRHRVVALDFRSHGASTPCGATWTVADAVADVRAVVDTLHLDIPWLIGHSIGGMVATQYAAKQGTCRGVVNIDGVGVSLPPVLPGSDPIGTRKQLQMMITQMVEALP
ncbi:MAG: alpha/beta hydrolase, partial [Chloroflexi bacterium]|nr:alpha/beta hydrolase [Chloroflexota bacterium]